MTANAFVQIALYLVVLLVLVKPLGGFIARVYDGKPTFLDPLFRPLESFIYRVCGVRADEGMTWQTYAFAMLLVNAIGVVFVYAVQRLQGVLPLNPQGFSAVTPDSSFNTATSFVTNTNWQGYGGESTMSYLTQMLAQNFLSAATAMAILVALIRGFRSSTVRQIGNFWVDFTRSVLYILLPLSFVLAIILVSQGVVQNFSAYKTVSLIQSTTATNPVKDAEGNPVLDEKGQPKTETSTVTEQKLPMGPAASQIAIKQMGTNGGGFFNVNSSHPYENPTPLANFFEMLGILLISAALCYTFGQMVGDTRQGWAILAAMAAMLVVFLAVCVWAEYQGNPRITALGVDSVSSSLQPGGNMEGKEARFGVANSALWATITTAASNGSVNSMHDSFTPLGGLVPLFLIQLGEVVFGGVGCGLYGMLVFAIVAVFVAGLMVGRTPEYLGKKIESYEIKMASLIILIPPIFILGLTALGVVTEAGLAGRANKGAHGLSEILYAFSSMAGNNGSAFAGLSANVPFYNALGGIEMLFTRFWLAIPTLAIAGSLAQKKHVPAGPGTLPTHTPLFVVMLIGVVIIVGALTFIPALALGPIVEHLMMVA